jgi:hypothetical protein
VRHGRFFVADRVRVRKVVETRADVRVTVFDERDRRRHRIRFHEADPLRRAQLQHSLRAWMRSGVALTYVRTARSGALIDVAGELEECLARS